MSHLYCKNCGAEVVLPEHSSFGCGITLAKDTDNNKYYLNMENTTEYKTTNNIEKKEIKNMGKVTERLNTLKAAGIDTSNFFSVLSPSGDEVAMKWENGIPTPVDLDVLDPVEREIYANGYVKNTKLHRRWIMSQMFRALNSHGGFTEWLKMHGYKYQWTMVLEECRVMSKIEGKDEEAFNERSTFFNQYVIKEMLNHYLFKLDKYIFNLKEHKCKGVSYYRIPRFGNIFVADIDKKIFAPFIKLYNQIKYTEMSYKDLYILLLKFKKIYIELPYDTPMSKYFIDTYKGEGAYYTLKNMILFHGVKVPEYGSSDNVYEGEMAMNYLQHETYENMQNAEGYKTLALLKETIRYNNFDFDKRMEELGVY